MAATNLGEWGGGGLAEAFAALKEDLLREGGPQISTMTAYRFALVPYRPRDEYDMRKRLRDLQHELDESGWQVLGISLHECLLQRLRAKGDGVLQGLIDREKDLYRKKGAERALNYINEELTRRVEGPEGIAADVTRLVESFAQQYPDQADRTVIFIQGAGALYPFYRSSALLRHLAGRNRNIPVILLYPGTRESKTGLRFMDEFEPDRDYRPRIYP
jgi:hypothetical protein